MAKKVFRAAKGAAFSHKEAQVLGKYIESLGSEVTPDDLVVAAESPKSPAHKFFEWEDTEAARLYRLVQARTLISHITVIIVSNGREEETKAFHSVVIKSDDSQQRVYVGVGAVAKDVDFKRQVIEGAYQELKAWEERYKQYRSIFRLASIDREFQTVSNVVKSMGRKVRTQPSRKRARYATV